MSITLQIKRSQVTNTPTSLALGELAYSEASDTLFIGVTGNGVYAIGGAGKFALKNSPTFTGTPAAPTPATGDNSTTIATTAFVKNQNYLTGNQTITISGDVSGSGTTSISLSLANVVTAGTAAKVQFNAKGLVIGTAALIASDIPKTLDNTWITDFNTQVRASRLDQMSAPTASVSMNSQKIVNLAAPTNPNDAATKAYVDAAVQGLSVKNSVRVLGASNVTLSGTQTIDGVVLQVGDRVLLNGQTTSSQNGIWQVASGAWVRPTDFPTGGNLSEGIFTFVEEGTIYASTGWVSTQSGDTVGLIDSSNQNWTQFSGAGAISAGNGLTKSGNQISAVGVANQITVSGSGIGISSTYVGQASIVTVGTITTGTWNGTAIDVAHGGTGLTATTNGCLIYGSGTAGMVTLPIGSSGTILVSNGTIPGWSSSLDGGSF